MCNVDSHGGIDKNGNTAPPAPEEFFLLLLLLLPYISWGRLEGFSGGVKDTPAVPRRRIYPLSRPPREGQSLDVVEWILIGFLHLFTPDVLLELEVDAFL